MDKTYIVTIFMSMIAIFTLCYNNLLILKNTHKILRRVCCIGYTLSIFKYLTLMIYGAGPSLNQVQALKPFYFMTMIGLSIPLISAIWYITPFCKMKWTYKRYVLFFIPWIIFGLYTIFLYKGQVQRNSHGYEIEIIGSYLGYYVIGQVTFALLVLGVCVTGWIRYKNERLRSQYFVFIFIQILFLVDVGILYFKEIVTFFPPFTVTEILAFLGIAYAFSKVPIEKKYKE